MSSFRACERVPTASGSGCCRNKDYWSAPMWRVAARDIVFQQQHTTKFLVVRGYKTISEWVLPYPDHPAHQGSYTNIFRYAFSYVDVSRNASFFFSLNRPPPPPPPSLPPPPPSAPIRFYERMGEDKGRYKCPRLQDWGLQEILHQKSHILLDNPIVFTRITGSSAD